MIQKVRKYSRTIHINTLKLLLARSGNQCAFPNCKHPLFNDSGVFIAQLCHIEGVAPLSERHNINKTDKETNAYDNLLFLCYRHHIETNNVQSYTVDELKEIKKLHEENFKETTYDFTRNILKELIDKTNLYWQKIDKLYANHVVPELAVPLNPKSNILMLVEEINEQLKSLSDLNSAFMGDLKKTHFEFVCLAIPNIITRSSVALTQLKIKYIEELILNHPIDQNLQATLKKLRKEFEVIAKSGGLVD